METEFGALVADPTLGSPEDAVEAIKNYVFDELKLGAIDLHSRDDVFEPARSGGFLLNGGRLYIDAVGSHLEYATAESIELKDLVANDRAGQRQIVRAIKDLGLSDQVFVYNNSIDHFGGHTFGCHENYLVKADDALFSNAVHGLYPFLVTRQIFAGVGRVGGHVLTSEHFRPSYAEVAENPIDYIWVSSVYGVEPDDTVDFQLSQRADHILKTIASRVRFNRALINPKWEHYYSHDSTTRLHLLFGESNQNEYAYALKMGTTELAVQLMEDGLIDESLYMAQPLTALRSVSRDPRMKWVVELADGRTIGSIDLQRRYLSVAQRYRGANAQTDWILDEWESTLDGLETDPMSMGDRIDWVAKKLIVETYRDENGLDWGDDALHSVDLEYHNINPDQSLFSAWSELVEVQRIGSELDVLDAMTDPPQNTRARARAELVARAMKRRGPRTYMFDWSGVSLDRYTYVDLSDPYNPSLPETLAPGP